MGSFRAASYEVLDILNILLPAFKPAFQTPYWRKFEHVWVLPDSSLLMAQNAKCPMCEVTYNPHESTKPFQAKNKCKHV